MTPSTKNTTVAVVVFLTALLLWAFTISHDILGFRIPISPEAVGLDLFSAMVWVSFGYSIARLYRSFRSSETPRVESRQPVGKTVAFAASVLIVFALGWAVRD